MITAARRLKLMMSSAGVISSQVVVILMASISRMQLLPLEELVHFQGL